MWSQVWWHTPLILAHGRQRQVNLWIWGQPVLYSDQISRDTQWDPVLKKLTIKSTTLFYLCILYLNGTQLHFDLLKLHINCVGKLTRICGMIYTQLWQISVVKFFLWLFPTLIYDGIWHGLEWQMPILFPLKLTIFSFCWWGYLF